MDKIKVELTKLELYKLLLTYFTSEVESCPLNAAAFIEVFFEKYQARPYIYEAD